MEELIEKLGSDMALCLWEHRREQTENPITGIHFWSHLMLFKMLCKLGQMLSYEHLYDVGMLVEARQPHLVDISELALLDQFHEQPEGQGVRAVHQQLPYKEIHPLHVVCLVIVAGKCPKHFS